MRETKFGRIQKHKLMHLLQGKFEVIVFDDGKKGTPHTHDTEEIAITVSGRGRIWIGNLDCPGAEHIQCLPGEMAVIPAGSRHWMEPDPGEQLQMVILYCAIGFKVTGREQT